MNETQLERIANSLETIAQCMLDKGYGEQPSTKCPQVEVIAAVNEIIAPDTIEERKYTLDDIKNKLIEINRNDDTAKPKLKALLGAFSAVRASDLKEDDFLEIMCRLETGEY